MTIVTTNANTRSLHVRAYQREAGLRRRAKRSPGIRLGVLRPMSTNGDPRSLIEEITKRGEDFKGRIMKRGSYFPLLLIFVLLLLIIS
jgi:hypothetical protein